MDNKESKHKIVGHDHEVYPPEGVAALLEHLNGLLWFTDKKIEEIAAQYKSSGNDPEENNAGDGNGNG